MPLDIPLLRLHNQSIANAAFSKPGEVVAWMGAIQAQDYLGALWAVGLRLPNAVEADIESALVDRTIIRTWPMRGTLHFVAAADIRWMLELLTPRIVAGAAQRLFREAELDEATFSRSKKLFARALQGGGKLTRPAMYKVLEQDGISTSNYRGLHILGRLAQDGFICFGSREGKQQTFALLDEWAPNARRMARDESLAEIAKRYFTSRGPATLQDFAWWSGLTISDAKAALDMSKNQLAREDIDGQSYWMSSSVAATNEPAQPAYLLPAYDEYTVAYKDRSAVLKAEYIKQVNSGNGIFYPTMVVNGQLVGTWKRTIKKDEIIIIQSAFTKLKRAETHALSEAAKRYGNFLNSTVLFS